MSRRRKKIQTLESKKIKMRAFGAVGERENGYKNGTERNKRNPLTYGSVNLPFAWLGFLDDLLTAWYVKVWYYKIWGYYASLLQRKYLPRRERGAWLWPHFRPAAKMNSFSWFRILVEFFEIIIWGKIKIKYRERKIK